MKKEIKVTKEKLTEAVRTSKTIREICNKLGIFNAGKGYVLVRQKIEQFQIDGSHLPKQRSKKLYHFDKMSKDMLALLVKENTSIAAICKKLNVPQEGQVAIALSNVIKNAGLDTSHFTGSLWSKGFTKEDFPNLARPEFIGRRFGASLYGHTEETKKKLSIIRTEYLKNSANRKNLGRQKPSWMETTFEKYLNENKITGWETEIHFWNAEKRKNYYPDFIFEQKKLIIELDGTQHRKTVELDVIRDEWFNRQGYKVVRITHPEFKERFFSGKGFLDLIQTAPYPNAEEALLESVNVSLQV